MAQSIQHDQATLILELSAASTPNIHSPITSPGSQLRDAIVSIPLVQNIRQVSPKVAAIWSSLLGKEVRYTGEDMDAFEEQMRTRAPSWSAFDIRMMFQGYLERGFAAEKGDLKTLTELLGHAPRSYEEFARETALEWQNNKGLHVSPAA